MHIYIYHTTDLPTTHHEQYAYVTYFSAYAIMEESDPTQEFCISGMFYCDNSQGIPYMDDNFVVTQWCRSDTRDFETASVKHVVDIEGLECAIRTKLTEQRQCYQALLRQKGTIPPDEKWFD